MVDRLKLLVQTCLSQMCLNKILTPAKSIDDYWDYYLPNETGDHCLQIKYHDSYFLIDGSIRKWFLGKNTLRDLSLAELIAACKKIAQCLEIESDQIFLARILIIEFGKNVIISTDCASVISRIQSYSCFKRVPIDNYVAFRSKVGISLTFYDKVEETKRKKKPEEPEVLRVEIRCSKFSAINDKFRGAQTIADVIKNYRMIVVSFLKEIKRLEMTPILLGIDNVSFYGKSVIEIKKYAFLLWATQIGKQRLNRYFKQTQMASSGRSNQFKILREIAEKYKATGTYGKADLIKEITKPLCAEISRSNPRLYYCNKAINNNNLKV